MNRPRRALLQRAIILFLFFPVVLMANRPKLPYQERKSLNEFWWSTAESSLRTDSAWLNLISNLRVKLSIPSDQQHYFNFEQKPGWEGLLLLQKTNRQARPLIVVRGGISSDPLSFNAERIWLNHLYHTSSAHILFLGNTFQKRFLNTWGQTHWGPKNESQQLIALTSYLLQQFPTWFSELHLVGISLGGRGIWLSSAASSVKSVTLICPQLDLKVKKHSSYPWISQALSWLWLKWRLPEWSTHSLSNLIEAYLSDGQPLPFATKPVPTWLVQSDQDPLVDPLINRKILFQLRPTTQLLVLKNSIHCSIPAAQPNPELLKFLQKRSLSQSR